MTEGRLQRIGRTARDPGEAAAGDRGADVGAGAKRAGHRAPAGLYARSTLRTVIHAFNESGVRGTGPKMERGQAEDDQ
jgi:hypothetical protein